MNARSPTTPLRIALLGARGRMGLAILDAARAFRDLHICAVVVRDGSADSDPRFGDAICTASVAQALAASDVLIDFSSPGATVMALDACVAARKPMVSGVTGLGTEAHAKLAGAGAKIAVLAAPNMSLGANLLIALTQVAAKALGTGFDIEITDIHHRNKLDAPSGTALAIGAAAAAARGQQFDEQAVFARHGRDAARRPGSIGFASLRAGEIAGEHRVLFAGGDETVELVHRATSRAAFAHGALAAARWIVRQPAGVYGMADVLDHHA